MKLEPLVLLLRLAFVQAVPNCWAPLQDTSMEQILEPLRNLQIIIHRPEQVHSSHGIRRDAIEQQPLESSLRYITHNMLPIQLFSAQNRGPASHAARHVQNKVAWIIFVVADSITKELTMDQVLLNCLLWSDKSQVSAAYEELLHVVTVHAVAAGPTAGSSGYNFAVRPAITPYFLIIFHWYPPEGLVHQLTRVFDVCYDDGNTCRVYPLQAYKHLAFNDDDGIEGVVHHVNKIRQDFQGDRLAVGPFDAGRELGDIPAAFSPLESIPLEYYPLTLIPRSKNSAGDNPAN